jgi:23S rRNA (guanosine2251-2'-O)-methyltransferase
MTTANLIVGWHAVLAALRSPASQLSEIWLRRGRHDRRSQEVIELARRRGVRVHEAEIQELDQQAPGFNHQGVLAFLRGQHHWSEDDLDGLLEGLQRPPFLLILDGVQDPHNLGACLRTADAAGVDAVIVPKDRAAGLGPGVRKSAAGAAESLPLIQVTNLARTMRTLKEKAIWLIGAAGEADRSLYQADLKGPLALVLGAEEKGLRRLTREECDLVVGIPMRGSVASLNVSVATAVCLYEAVRQRG